MCSEDDFEICWGLRNNNPCPFHAVAEIYYYDPATQKEGKALMSVCLRGDCDVWQTENIRLFFVVNYDKSEFL